MKSVLSVLVLLALTCIVFADINSDWTSYKTKFNKKYANAQEENLRKTIYFLNLLEVKLNNKLFAEKKARYELSINQYSDFTYKELDDHHRSLEIPGFKPVASLITDPEWVKYKHDLNKTYDVKVDHFRYTIFRKTLAFIKKHNQDFKDGKVAFNAEVNKYTDLTLFEEPVQ